MAPSTASAITTCSGSAAPDFWLEIEFGVMGFGTMGFGVVAGLALGVGALETPVTAFCPRGKGR